MLSLLFTGLKCLTASSRLRLSPLLQLPGKQAAKSALPSRRLQNQKYRKGHREKLS